MRIKKELSKEDESLCFDRIETLISMMTSTGQIDEENKLIDHKDGLISVNVLCIEENFFRYSNKEILKEMSFLKKEFEVEFSFKKNGINIFFERIPFQKDADSYIIYPGAISIVRAFENLKPIPFYRITYKYFDNLSFEEARFWQNNYFAILGLWNRGSINEKSQSYQLSNIFSSLNQQGITVRNLLQKKTRKPSYYYLFRYPSKQLKDVCPSCGQNWKLGNTYLGEFDYLCKKCRLIS